MTILEEVRGLLAYLKTNDPNVTANNLSTAVIPTIEKLAHLLGDGQSATVAYQDEQLLPWIGGVVEGKPTEAGGFLRDLAITIEKLAHLLGDGQSATVAYQDEQLLPWIGGVVEGKPTEAGGFLRDLAMVALKGDHENYPVLRPAIMAMAQKYPRYRDPLWIARSTK